VRLGGPERRVHRRLVDDAVAQDRGRAGRGEGPEDRRGEPFRDGRIGPRAFRRERQSFQPIEQGQRVAEAGVRDLREVSVQVDHAREDDPRPEVRDRGQPIGAGIGRPEDRADAPRGVDLDDPVGDVPCPPAGEWRDDPRADREGRA